MRVEDVKKVVVVGAGIMGHGIAMVTARSGFPTYLVDVSQEVLDNAMKLIRDGPFGLMRIVEKGKITKEEMEEIISRITPTTDPEEAGKDADVLIEAVPENIELKHKVYQLYDKICPERTIFASNTSGIMITELAAAVPNRADKFIGMHWFNPAQVMALIEVVRGALTSDETFEFMMEFCRKLGKIPLEAKDGPGFFTSRFILLILTEAVRLFEEGVAGIKEIDEMCKLGFGWPMGPFELMDLTGGVDIMMEGGEYYASRLGDPRFIPPLTARKLWLAGYRGKKLGSKGGWYDFFKVKKE